VVRRSDLVSLVRAFSALCGGVLYAHSIQTTVVCCGFVFMTNFSLLLLRGCISSHSWNPSITPPDVDIVQRHFRSVVQCIHSKLIALVYRCSTESGEDKDYIVDVGGAIFVEMLNMKRVFDCSVEGATGST